jgi:hypothetical protein
MSYPVLEFDWRKNNSLADNIWNAQMAGHPKILTYSGPDLTVRRAARRGAMHFEHLDLRYEIPHILSRGEYPFACTLEGGKASWVGHIPGRENSSQGGMIAAFLREHLISPERNETSKFLVRVTNHPGGPVTATCKPRCAACAIRCQYV